MLLKRWEDLPLEMQTETIKYYYDILDKKRGSLFIKRLFDVFAALILLVILSPLFLILAIAIKLDSPGPVFYRQERVTQYGKVFRIHKFRTMVQGADKGSHVTVNNDTRITKLGHFIRRFRLDEFPQLFDVVAGNITFVGVRPEATRFVAAYTEEMMATLLLPAGITSTACLYYKDEAQLLNGVDDADTVYVRDILPKKMRYNLQGIVGFSCWHDLQIMIATVLAVLGKEYKDDFEESDKTLVGKN